MRSWQEYYQRSQIDFMRAFFEYIKYTYRHRKAWFILILLLFLSTTAFLRFWNDPFALTQVHNEYLNTSLAILGMFVTLWILIVDLREEWIKDLPKKLTVYFKHFETNEVLMAVFEAPLISKEDIRQWAQQIGKNLNNQQDLDLKYFRLTQESRIQFFSDESKFYEYFELEYFVGTQEREAITKEEPVEFESQEIGRLYEALKKPKFISTKKKKPTLNDAYLFRVYFFDPETKGTDKKFNYKDGHFPRGAKDAKMPANKLEAYNEIMRREANQLANETTDKF